MPPVQREDLVDYVTYERRVRDEILGTVLKEKAKRRIHVGEYLTFLFENDLTIRYQVQEMMRVEQIVAEEDIRHELKTYNELLGDAGGLGCTLLIEIDDPERRDTLLRDWLDLPSHLYAVTASGDRVRPVFDERQVGTDRVSSVQYLKFPMEGRCPTGLGCDHPKYTALQALSPEQAAALLQDLQPA